MIAAAAEQQIELRRQSSFGAAKHREQHQLKKEVSRHLGGTAPSGGGRHTRVQVSVDGEDASRGNDQPGVTGAQARRQQRVLLVGGQEARTGAPVLRAAHLLAVEVEAVEQAAATADIDGPIGRSAVPSGRCHPQSSAGHARRDRRHWPAISLSISKVEPFASNSLTLFFGHLS
jgi:hypothetical protein